MSNVLGPGWRSANLQLKRLDNIQVDIGFASALENRQIVANTKLNQQATDSSDNSVEISGSVRDKKENTSSSFIVFLFFYYVASNNSTGCEWWWKTKC